jgi:succinyl-diaminopimelate desuccinylase
MSEYSRLIEIFEDLVGFRTVTGNHAEAAKCLDYASVILKKAGMHINRYSSNGFESIVATSQKTRTPKLLLQAHIDVVPARRKMFKLTGMADKLVGRGAFDMKYAAACYLWMVEELGKKAAKYDFGIMFTSDEEQGGLNGVDYLLDQGYSCKVSILPDGGDDWRLESAAKGLWQFDVIVGGVSAHASRPWIGDNAATGLLEFIEATKGLAPAGDHADTTMVLSRLQAGEAYNQVPAKAVASYDVRFFEEKDRQEIERALLKLADKHDVQLETQNRAPALKVDVSLPVIQRWEAVVSGVRGTPPAGYGLSFGASDARYFADRNIPTIVTRPKGGGHHGDDEWIDESELYQFYECLRRFVEVYSPVKKPAK